MSDKRCGLFHELYDTKPTCRSCFNEQIGKEYICPRVSQGGIQVQPLSNWFSHQGAKATNPPNATCLASKVSQNIGINSICGRPMATTWINNQAGGATSGCGVAQSCINDNRCCDRGYCRETYGPNYYNLAALGLEGKMQLNAQQAQLMAQKQTGGCGCSGFSEDQWTNLYKNKKINRVPDVQRGGNARQNVSTSSFTVVDGCPEFDSMRNPPKSAREYVCGDRIRCGNGSPTTKLHNTGCDCNCTEVIPKIWDQPINPNRTYGFSQAEEPPGYYLDVSQPPIGDRPVVVHSNREAIPSMLLVNNVNLPDRDFSCKQPCWGPNCL